MLKNQLKIALRNIRKRKLFSLINVIGLATGVATALITALYVFNELSYDRFHEKGDQLYRVLRKSNINGNYYTIGITSAPFAKALQNDFPREIKSVVRVMPNNALVRYQANTFTENKFFLADSNFFRIFSFPLLRGNPATVLANPNSVVMTKRMVAKYFAKEENPIGKVIRVVNQFEMQVTDVLDDLPANSHLDFDFVASISSLERFDWFQGWWNNNLCTYVELAPAINPKALESRLPLFMDKYFGKDFAANRHRIDLSLQPLKKVYFESDTRYDPVLHGNIQAVYIFSFAAVLVVIIACFNFVNFSTATASERSKEVGVYKVLGAARNQLIFQFFNESFLLTLIAVLVAVLLVEFTLPFFNAQFQFTLRIPYHRIETIAGLAGLVLLLSGLSGLYPAVVLSSFQPILALKGKVQGDIRSVLLKKGLVIFQFGISVVLIISTLIMKQQLRYLQNQEMGFDKERIVLVSANNPDIQRSRASFRQAVKRLPFVLNVSAMEGQPGGMHDATSVAIKGREENLRMRTVFADFDYVKTLGIKLVAGRDFSEKYYTDSTQAALLNEKAVRALGWSNEEAIGKEIRLTMFDSTSKKVIGVVRDYHFSSLRDQIEPLVICATPNSGLLAIKIAPENIRQTLAALEKDWKAFSPEYPFEYRFLDEEFNKLYQNENRQGKSLLFSPLFPC